MIVEIKPIPREKWHGKKGKEDFSRPIKIGALVNGDTLKYETGLTKKDIETLMDKGVAYDLSDVYLKDTPHPFWDSSVSKTKLENFTVLLDTEKPLEFIKYKYIKASKFVANSLAEYNQGLFPDASHYIFDEKEEVEVKATKVAARNEAVLKCSTLSLDAKVQLILLVEGKNLRGKSTDTVEVVLDEMIQTKASDVLITLGKDKKKRALRALVKEGLQKAVLRKKGGKVYYFDEQIGLDEADAADYLGKPKNQELKVRIQTVVENNA